MDRNDKSTLSRVEPSSVPQDGEDHLNAEQLAKVNWRTVLAFSVPVSAAMLLQYALNPISMAIVGPLGSVALGATSLSISLFNAGGYSLILGLCGALDTILSQIYGKTPTNRLYGTVALRLVFILMIALIPVAAITAYLDVLLTSIGMPPEVVVATTEYARVQMFGLPFMAIFEVLRRYLQNQHCTRPIVVIQAAALVTHVTLQILAVRVLGLGLKGSAGAWVILIILMNICLLAFIRANWQRFEPTWPHLNRGALQSWWGVLREGLSAYGMTVVEWSAFELCNATSGYLSTVDLAAYSIVLQCYALAWASCNGFFYAGAFFAGESIGNGAGGRGRVLVSKILMMNGVLLAFNSCVMLTFGYRIAGLFTDDDDVRRRARQVFAMAALFHVGDATQSCCIGITRGVGIQTRGAIIMGITWVVVGLPLNMLFTFTLGFGAPGLYMGFFIATMTVGLPSFFFTLFRRLKWEELKPVEAAATPMG
jgi:MATE family multidrug resistance protein